MIDLSMTNFHSSFAQLLQSNVNDVSEAPTSLFDLINAHKSTKEVYVEEDVEKLSDLTSRSLSLKDDVTCCCATPSKSSPTDNEFTNAESSNFNTLEEYAQSFLSNNSRNTFLNQKPTKGFVTNETTNTELCNRETANFNTLEEYSRSFLNDNYRSTLPSQKPLQESVAHETTANTIIEKLSNINICSPSQYETRKIDLTAALLGSPQRMTTAVVPERTIRSVDRVSYPVRECMFDLSTLADENIVYGNDDLSHFGYVISKKWSRNPLLNRYRKMCRSKPYNIRKAFKFDTPSPDDIALRARNRTTSGSKD